jgi:hypothetical protein
LSLGFFCGLFWVFFSGSRVFLLGFLVGFGLGPLGVFFGFFSFFVLALAARVYPQCTQERLTLFSKLTYLSKKKIWAFTQGTYRIDQLSNPVRLER